MKSVIIRKAQKKDSQAFLSLVNALADYEKLKRPSITARKRLIRDAFGKRPKFEALLAFVEETPAGYAIFFQTYSSFLALPTLYLEDLFVLPEFRKQKIGVSLFTTCLAEARKRGCGRMEWMVLDWNSLAIDFYKKLGAKHLKGWLPFRMESKQFNKILKRTER
jgi:GNAT superfamily N-acetyltransferase